MGQGLQEFVNMLEAHPTATHPTLASDYRTSKCLHGCKKKAFKVQICGYGQL